ncbi:hypothetical protein D3C71_1600550 [compost metagenome]
MEIFKLATMHTVDKVWNQVHRARTVKGYEGDNFFKFTWTCFLEHFFHAHGFKLEDCCGVGIGKDEVCIFVIKRNERNV